MITGTIAVCTRNRAELLRQCLAALDNQLVAPDQVEILVVDNGSTDATPEVLRGWADGDGRRCIREPAAGLSRARNTALEASDREVVLFLDDDALAPPLWAAIHLEAYERGEHTGSAGGPIGLEWPAGRPAWITDGLTQWYGALELGDETGPFPTDHGPYGTNMSVRRKAALAVGGYDATLGRGGGKLLSGEEPDLTRRLRDAGWEVVYAGGAAVIHQVPAERVDRRWLLRRGWWQGVSNARLELLAGQWPSRAARIGRARGELLDAGRRIVRWRSERHEPEALADLVVVLAHAAAGVELLRAAAGRRSAAGR
jgi:glycosyltransferase involved in cell wall biosynthesis